MTSKRYPYSNIFILGHMRSRSSLLCHILMSNRNIYGIGESNACYKNRLNLEKVKLITRIKYRQSFFKSPIFVDQINHNHKTPNLNIIINPDSRIIFLIRNPNDAIQSILKLTADYYTPWSVVKAVKYYNTRLQFLISLTATTNPSYYHIIRSEDLIENTDFILSNLTKFLNLKSPLTPEYKLFSFSGTHGDPSSTLKNSKIVKNKKHAKLDENLDVSFQLYNQIVTKL